MQFMLNRVGGNLVLLQKVLLEVEINILKAVTCVQNDLYPQVMWPLEAPCICIFGTFRVFLNWSTLNWLFIFHHHRNYVVKSPLYTLH